MKYSAGIIGCGFIGSHAKDSHARAYKECSDTELVFMMDADKNRAINAADKWDVPFSCMVEPIDIVSICTPPETHLEVVQCVLPLSNLKAVYLEKPIATTLEDADRIIKLCKMAGAILQVNHQRRFLNPVMRFSRGILNTGTHAFDLLTHMFGEVSKLTATQITFANGITVDIELMTTEWPVFEFDACHNKDRMVIKGVEHLVKCIKEGRESVSSGQDARRDLELCLKFQELNESKLRVS